MNTDQPKGNSEKFIERFGEWVGDFRYGRGAEAAYAGLAFKVFGAAAFLATVLFTSKFYSFLPSLVQ